MSEAAAPARTGRRTPRLAMIVGGGAALVTLLGACGGGSSPSVSSTTGTSANGSAVSIASVSGKVIASSATSAAVQQTSGPATVDYGSDTRFTTTASTTRAALATGDCVTVSTGTTDSAATNGATAAPTTITAKTVTVTSTSGCQPPSGFGRVPGGGSFTPPAGGGFTPPAGGFGENGGTPRPFPTGSAFPRLGPGSGGFVRRAFGGAFGTIASITATSFTVTSPFGSSTTTTVKTTSSTMYDATSAGSAADVKSGKCVTAVGSDDVSGNLDARSVSISSPVNGSCPAAPAVGGFGGFAGGRFATGGFPEGSGGA